MYIKMLHEKMVTKICVAMNYNHMNTNRENSNQKDLTLKKWLYCIGCDWRLVLLHCFYFKFNIISIIYPQRRN